MKTIIAALLCVWFPDSSFRTSPELRILAAFGYKDARPARYVGDRYERRLFVDEILKMGFVRSQRDEDLFFHAGKRIRLRAIQASVGPDDDENRLDPYQKMKSDLAKKTFLQAIAQDDVVIYNGHSRDGGGPDFKPPLLRFDHHGADHHVNYSAYQRRRREMRDLLKAWKHADRKPAEFALFSCYSEQHFSKALRQVCADCKFTTVKKLIYYADALQQMLDVVKKAVAGDYRPIPEEEEPRSAELD